MRKKYKNILVTGGAGFIGSHLVELLLKKKYNIFVIDNLSTGRKENIEKFASKIKFLNADISVIGRWTNIMKKIDIVYHLAALADIVPSIQNPNKYFKANVVGTQNILDQCIKNNVKKVIYTASSSCYGIPNNYPTKETEIIDPKYPYALTKKIGEDLLIHYNKIFKLKTVSLRLFNVYGTKSRTSGTYGAMFGVFLKQKLSNIPLTIVGTGRQKRDFTYVKDVVNALFKCIKYNCKKKIINIGTGDPISINKIAELLKSKKIYIPKRPGEPEITQANVNLARKELKWKAKIKIGTGIKLILKDINYWKKAPLWTPNKIKIATKDWFKYLS
jgi:UDP-glucose 4-epimerase